LAIGFCTKGHIAVVTPAAGAFFYILYTKNWRSFYHPQLLLLLAAFFVFISPVVYCYYLQYDLHPETVVRGRSKISGVQFILWQQNFERFQGDSFGSDAKNDYFFFFHSFLWAFAPWSLLAFVALFHRIKNITARKWEWFTLGSIAFIALILTFSGFKLPHYLNIIFPASAVLTAGFLQQLQTEDKHPKPYAILQTIICVLLLVLVALLNVWAFPVYQIWIIVGFLVLISVSYWLLQNVENRWQKIITGSVLTSACVWFLLNSNFYPQLLTYQAGNELAQKVKETTGTENLFQQPDLRSFSFDFYTKSLTRTLPPNWVEQGNKAWVLADREGYAALKRQYRTGTIIRHRDFSVTQLIGTFINPATRRETLEELMLVELLGPKQD
jgi:4-amino-4-deoxy-L-arabinose transferase-like glycosyltransferase